MSPLEGVVGLAHPYMGILTLAFLLLATALLAGVAAHQARHRSFLLSSTIDDIIKRAQHSFSPRANAPGILAATLLSAAAVLLLVFHYQLLAQGNANAAALSLELATLALQLLAAAFCLLLVFLHHSSADSSLSRQLTLESLALLISLFGLFLHRLLRSMALLCNPSRLHVAAAASSLVELGEASLQTAFLLSSLRFYAKFFKTSVFRVQQSLTLWLVAYNAWQAAAAVVRQEPTLYGEVVAAALGFWGSAVAAFWLHPFVLAHRLFAATAHASLWIRSYRN